MTIYGIDIHALNRIEWNQTNWVCEPFANVSCSEEEKIIEIRTKTKQNDDLNGGKTNIFFNTTRIDVESMNRGQS